MSKTTIEWCIKPGTKPETWNPTTGCNKVSQGCKNCYAEIMHKRLTGMGQSKYQQPFLDGAVKHPDTLDIPFKWKNPRTIFVNSMSDLFHENISFSFIWDVWEVMSACQHHTFIILTKRPKKMVEYFEWMKQKKGNDIELPNVWLGVSCEDQATADERIPLLQQVPARVHFLSCEPLLGPIKFNYEYFLPFNDIKWIIAGGESGRNARPMHPDWVRSIRDQCKADAVPFFFKQWGEYIPSTESKPIYANTYIGWEMADKKETTVAYKVGKKKAGRLLDGVEWNEFPRKSKSYNHAHDEQ